MKQMAAKKTQDDKLQDPSQEKIPCGCTYSRGLVVAVSVETPVAPVSSTAIFIGVISLFPRGLPATEGTGQSQGNCPWQTKVTNKTFTTQSVETSVGGVVYENKRDEIYQEP
ncbi:hypothetical protein CBL_09864 [Carabus blaptoides fortunei]